MVSKYCHKCKKEYENSVFICPECLCRLNYLPLSKYTNTTQQKIIKTEEKENKETETQRIERERQQYMNGENERW
jgi:hypothetical protein